MEEHKHEAMRHVFYIDDYLYKITLLQIVPDVPTLMFLSPATDHTLPLSGQVLEHRHCTLSGYYK